MTTSYFIKKGTVGIWKEGSSFSRVRSGSCSGSRRWLGFFHWKIKQKQKSVGWPRIFPLSVFLALYDMDIWKRCILWNIFTCWAMFIRMNVAFPFLVGIFLILSLLIKTEPHVSISSERIHTASALSCEMRVPFLHLLFSFVFFRSQWTGCYSWFVR